jgi:hypothetical protein
MADSERKEERDTLVEIPKMGMEIGLEFLLTETFASEGDTNLGLTIVHEIMPWEHVIGGWTIHSQYQII